MSVYKVGVPHDVAANMLTPIPQQPKSNGVRASRRIFMGDGSVLDQGLYVDLEFEFIDGETDVDSIFSLFNLDVEKSQEVTIYARNDLYQWKRYNGTAIRPQPSWNDFFPRGVVIRVTKLEELA